MTALSTIRDQIVRRLVGSKSQVRDRLFQVVDAVETQIVVSFDRPGIGPDAVLEFEDTGEQIYVWSETAANTYLVERAFNGTVGAGHAALVGLTVNPRWPRQEIFGYMLDEIQSWPDELGADLTVDVPMSTSDDVIEIPTIAGRRITRLGRVYHKEGYEVDWEPVDASLVRSDDFTSGWALRIERRTTGVLQLHLIARPDVATLTAASDLVTLGFEKSVEDILILGTMWRAMMAEEASRSDGVGVEAARLEGLPPTYQTQTAEYFRVQRDKRIADETWRVHNRFPILMTVMP
jgi:hypothetical protein